MTILVVGGGSGGHITPNLAVAHAIKQLNSNVNIVYISLRKEKLREVIDKSADINSVRSIFAGKFRRYHGLGFSQFLNIKTLYLNTRDLCRTIIGFFESLTLLLRLKPSVIFIKGGFVGVPVGLAAGFLKIPFITHDTDVLPGLANRLIARFATVHAVSQQETADKYYRDGRSIITGPIIGKAYKEVSMSQQLLYKHQLGIDENKPVILVTGGGLGARRLNVAAAEFLAQNLENIQVIHITGKGNLDETILVYKKYTDELPNNLTLKEYSYDMHVYSGAADVIITRAGATMLAEFAMQKKACVVVPNPQLTGGHQLLNARDLEKKDAAKVVAEDPSDSFSDRLNLAVTTLLKDKGLRTATGNNFYKTIEGQTNAAAHIAEILLQEAKVDV